MKKVFRQARGAFADGVLAMRDPQISARYRALRASAFRPEHHIKIVPEQKLVYIEIPKAASSTIKRLLRKHRQQTHRPNEEKPPKRLPTLRDIGAQNFFAMVDDANRFVFTFVRNPYARLVSCYRDKFERYPLTVKSGCMKDAHRFFGVRLRTLDPTRPLPFDWFIEMACATNRSGTDGHWMTESRLTPDLPVDFVGRVEAFGKDIRTVLDRTGISTAVEHVNMTGPQPLSHWIDDALRQKMYLAYRDDFERFEYSAALPS